MSEYKKDNDINPSGEYTGQEDWPYEDIVDLPHHVSKTHPQMPMEKRAAQFAPFAALTGYHELINEAGRMNKE